jgi:hypothetical protein
MPDGDLVDHLADAGLLAEDAAQGFYFLLRVRIIGAPREYQATNNQ